MLKDGISAEEIADVRKSFVDMGIDVTELFKALDEMEVEKHDTPPPPRLLYVMLLYCALVLSGLRHALLEAIYIWQMLYLKLWHALLCSCVCCRGLKLLVYEALNY